MVAGLVPARAAADRTLEAALKAHGGLKLWQKQSSATFEVRNWPFGAHAPFNARHKLDLKTGDGTASALKFRAGSSGGRAWVVPGSAALGQPPGDYWRLTSRLFTAPFGFAGARVEAKGSVTADGRAYDALDVSWRTSAGTETWRAAFDPATHRLRYVFYDVPGSSAPARRAVSFEEWQDAGGVLVPRQVTFSAWRGDRSGERSGAALFNDPRLGKDLLPPGGARPPADAVFEEPVPAP